MTSSRTRYSLYWVLHFLLIAIGVILARTSSVLAQAVGASIVAAGISGCVVFLYVLESQKRSQALEILDDFGVVRIFQGRGVRIRRAYDDELNRATNRIEILGFGLRSLLEDYYDEFPRWATRANVRVLLLDPEFPTQEH